MAYEYEYIGEGERIYPGLAGLEPVPGVVYELDEDPADGRWKLAGFTAEPADAPELAGEAEATATEPEPSTTETEEAE